MTGMTTRRLWVCAGALGLFSALPAAAQLDWVGTQGILFFDTATNWNPVQVPNGDVSVMFSIDVAGNPIVIGASSGANQMDFLNNNWQFTGAAGGTLNGGSVIINDALATAIANGANVTATNNLTWSNGGDTLLGDTGYGSLTLLDGSDYFTRQLFVGNTATGVGELNVIGPGTTVTATLNSNTGLFTIGRRGGTGTVNVLNGAQMLTSSTGGNDIWVGGYLDDDDGPGVITSTGTLNVSGAGSFVETEDLNVGIYGGNGFLNVSSGAQVVLTDGGTNGSPDVAFGANDGFGGVKSLGVGTVTGDGTLLRGRSIFVGASGIGTLEVSAGAVARTQQQGTSVGDMILGNSLGSSGKVAVHGKATNGVTNSLIDVDDTLIVGNAGLGVLNVGLNQNDVVVGGGTVHADGSIFIGNGTDALLENRVRVAGPGSVLDTDIDLIVGRTSTGYFNASGGAEINVDAIVYVGTFNGSSGTAIIDGAGTSVDAARLIVGRVGAAVGTSSGLYGVLNGAVTTLTSAVNGVVIVGERANGSGAVTVTGDGSVLQSTGGTAEWWIGGSASTTGGAGSMSVLDQGLVQSTGRLVIGYSSQSIGQVLVDGAGSQLNANGDYILVGFGGSGELNVTNGGVVNANRVFVADAAGSGGSTLTVDGVGSQLNSAGRFHVGDTSAGFVNVTNGGYITVGQLPDNLRLIIGNEGAADGSRLLIDGAGSRVDYTGTVDIAVGNAGGANTANLSDRAILQVTNGGVFSAVQRDGSNNITSQARIIVGDISGGNGYVKVDGPGSLVQASVMYVGDGDTSSSGVLDVTNGGVVDLTGEFQAGSNGNGVGSVNIDGPGSQLLVGSTLSLGDDSPGDGAATGTLNITDGGYVSNATQAYIGHFTGSFGTATLDSATADKSIWDIGGELTLAGTETSSQGSGFGILNVNTGGVVNIASNLRVRNLGDVNLSGGEINIGGDLILTDAGSTINFAFGKLGFTDPNGTTLSPTMLDRILALGGGNRPTLFTNMHLSIAGTAIIGGPLRINGGTLTAGSLTPASWVQLDFDAGTLNLTSSDLTVGAAGPLGKDLTINFDQALNVSQAITVQSGATLTVVGGLSAGTLANSGALTFIDTQAGAKAVDGTINMLAGGQLTVVGEVQFNGPVNGLTHVYGPGRAIFAGDFAPGNSPAIVSFDGGLGVASTGNIEIELGGTTAGTQYDQLVIAGDAQLGGTLELVLINGHLPTLGNAYTVLTSAGLNGSTFDSILGDAIGGGLALRVSYTATDVIVTAITALAGDTDLDGDIDDSDLGNALANYTGPVGAAGGKSLANGDTDGDGDVDDSDLGTALSGYTGPLSPTNVPEPASIITLIGLLGLTHRRRR